MMNFLGIEVPPDIVIRGHLFSSECKLEIDKKLQRKVFNILTLHIEMEGFRWTIREELMYARDSIDRNLEELKRLEVTERILNELK
jgi:hypothetical protein